MQGMMVLAGMTLNSQKNMIRSDACKSKRQGEIIILLLLYLSTSISRSVASPVFNLSKN